MNSNDLAALLRTVAEILESQPNRELAGDSSGKSERTVQSVSASPFSPKRKLDNLNKRELEAFIQSNKLPVPFRKKDSTAELFKRISRYLDSDPAAAKRVRNTIVHTPSKASPALMQALAYLLKGSL